MDINIPPSASEIRSLLESLTLRQLHILSDLSGIPFPTIRNIRYGATPNPGIETVRQVLIHVRAAAATNPTPTEVH